MYASLRGASSTEDIAKLNRTSTWNWLARAATNSSQSYTKRSFSVPTELPTPFADALNAKELVPQPLRPRTESTKTDNSRRSAKDPISIRGKRVSVGDLVGRFEYKDSGTDSAPTPIPRLASTPSTHLRSVYCSTLPRASLSTQISGQRPPRRRLVSSETIQEEGGPFTLKQVSAATSFTTPRTRAQNSISELPEAPAIETSPLRKDTAIQASCKYYNQATQAKADCQDQSVQAEHSYQHTSVQASSACQDQATQVAIECKGRYTQFTTQYTDRAAFINEGLKLGTTEAQGEPPEAKGKRPFHDQASQTDYDNFTVKRTPARSESNLPGFIHTVGSEEDLKGAASLRDIVLDANPESNSSTDVAFFTAKNCSIVSRTRRRTRRNGLLDISVSLEPNVITIEFPEGAKVHMLQRVRGGKIILDPGALPRATNSEALAQGEVYTPGYVREEEPKPADRCLQSASCSSCSSASSCFSLERRPTSPPKVAVTEASGTAEGSHYTEAKQHLTSRTHESADEFDSQQKVPITSKATPPADEVPFSATSFPEPLIALESSAQAASRPRVNSQRRASSVSYWFESEDEDPKQAGSKSVIRPQTLAQFRSVPLIRVQRPSTDSEMVFGLGTKAVKPSRSASPLSPATEAPAVPASNIALRAADLPTDATGGKKHFRDRVRDRRSKQAIPVDPAVGGKIGVRARVKGKGSNVGRKGRRKFIFRKKVLRILLGKDLAETVSQTLETAGNATRAATGAGQAFQGGSYGAVPTSAASKIPLPERALPLGATPLGPAQMDGSDGRIVSDQPSMGTGLGADVTPVISALDGSLERKAERHAKKEIKCQQKKQQRNAEYEQAKTNLEALISTPCIKCGGQRAYILNFVYENKMKMLKHEKPEMKRRHRRKAVTEYVESIECRCPRGTGTAAYGSPEAVPKAKEMFRHPKARTASQRESYSGGGGGSAAMAGAALCMTGGAAVTSCAGAGGCSGGGC